MEEKNERNACNGQLPACAPLAAAYVPMQENNAISYDVGEALSKGTLFPGLNLPFMNCENKGNPYVDTPLGELMALDFAVRELNLYLDTHKDDTEAFQMMKKLLALYQSGKEEYARQYGPLSLRDLSDAEKYDWTDTPWPWEYREVLR